MHRCHEKVSYSNFLVWIHRNLQLNVFSIWVWTVIEHDSYRFPFLLVSHEKKKKTRNKRMISCVFFFVVEYIRYRFSILYSTSKASMLCHIRNRIEFRACWWRHIHLHTHTRLTLTIAHVTIIQMWNNKVNNITSKYRWCCISTRYKPKL